MRPPQFTPQFVTLRQAEAQLQSAQIRLADALRSRGVSKEEINDLTILRNAWQEHVERLKT